MTLRPILLLALAFASRGATRNAVTIYDASGGSPTTNAVHSLLLTFPDNSTDGIATCVQPVVSGTPLTAYQNTVRRRYASGFLHQVYISFVYSVPASGSIMASFIDTAACNSTGGLDQAGILAYLSGAWSAQIKVKANPQGASTEAVTDAVTMITAGKWSYLSQGPVMTEILVEAPITATGAELFDDDFGFKNRKYTAVATTIAPSAKAGTLIDATEIATLVAANGTAILSIDSEKLSVCRVTGNVVAFGTSGDCPVGGSVSGRAQSGTTAAQHNMFNIVGLDSFASSEYIDAPSAVYKSLHPYFVLQFWTPNGSPYSGVRIEAVVENVWKSKLQTLDCTLELWAGSTAAKVYPASGTKSYTHHAATVIRKTIWSGTAPALTRIDHNFTWLKTVKAVPNYDPAITYVPASWYTSFAASDKGDIQGYATNSREYDANSEGALLQVPEVLFLQNMGDNCTSSRSDCAKVNEILFGESVEGGGGVAATSGHIPVHIRESVYDAKAKYWCPGLVCASGNTVAFGNIMSRDSTTGQVMTMSSPAYFTSALGPVRNSSYSATATPFVGHLQEHASLAYLLTGSYFYYREMLYSAHMGTFPQSPTSAHSGRWGWIKPSGYGNLRSEAWNLYQLGLSSWMAWDGTPEKSYFDERTANHIAIAEGYLNITDGTYPPADPACPGYAESSSTDPWCFGRNSGDAGTPPTGANVIGAFKNPTRAASTHFDLAVTGYDVSGFQHWFYVIALGRLAELGFGTNAISARMMLPTAALILNYNPYLANVNYPSVTAAGAWFADLDSWYLGFNAAARAVASFRVSLVSGYNSACGGHSYQHSLAAAMALNYTLIPTDGVRQYPVSAAYDWWNTNSVRCTTSVNPGVDTVPARWTIVPRTPAVRRRETIQRRD